MITLCPSCGSKTIRKVKENLKGEFQGQIYTVPSLEFYTCSDCGEKIYDRHAMRKIELYSPAYRKHTETKIRTAA